MGLHTKKPYYRRGGETLSIDLGTDPSDVGAGTDIFVAKYGE